MVRGVPKAGHAQTHAAGIVIRHEQMEYKTAVHHAYLVSTKRAFADRLRPPRCWTCGPKRRIIFANSSKLRRCVLASKSESDNSRKQNEVESLRLKTSFYEMIISQHGNFTLVVLQMEEAVVPKEAAAETEEKKGE